MKRAATVKCVFKDLIRLLNYMYTYIYKYEEQIA
jgi:hypothetical protein